jgi:hypothetical protein
VRSLLGVLGTVWGLCFSAIGAAPSDSASDLWPLARQNSTVHRFATLFSAQDVRDHLSSESGLRQAVDWCKQTGVTHVFIETFRDGYQAERAALQTAKQRFLGGGFIVSGCVTTTGVGKLSNGWKNIACYTDQPTQEKLQAVFEFAAGLFDEIMIDDFYFTDCTCAECEAARKSKNITIGSHNYPLQGDSWEDYHFQLMIWLSRDRVLGAAKRINPKTRVIIKYPQWYDGFHERGYEVVRETADFDRIWVGTETRDYADRHWGGTPQYEGYFIMRWLGGIGGPKCGGGWYDPFGTTERTYIEQARQTILGGARESLLFCYGALRHGTGPKNIEALRTNVPTLLEIAKQVRHRQIIGLAAYKPPNSHPGKEARVFDFIGMLGVPLVPCHEFPANAPAVFLSVHALKDSGLDSELKGFIKSGRPLLLTDGLAQGLSNRVDLSAPNVHFIPVKQDPKSLLELSQAQLDEFRAPLLRPLKTSFRAPNRVALYLFKDRSWVIENFNDEPVEAELDGKPVSLGPRAWKYHWN